jgi:hypothetical protein
MTNSIDRDQWLNVTSESTRYNMAQNGSVTAPDSQGVFRGKGWVRIWAPGNYSGAWIPCPAAGTSALVFQTSETNKKI